MYSEVGAAKLMMKRLSPIDYTELGEAIKYYVELSFDFIKEYGKGTFEIPKLVNDSYEGKNFYIIDDIYATGNTVKAIIEALKTLGGNVVGVGCVVNIPALNDDNDVYSIIDIEETN